MPRNLATSKQTTNNYSIPYYVIVLFKRNPPQPLTKPRYFQAAYYYFVLFSSPGNPSLPHRQCALTSRTIHEEINYWKSLGGKKRLVKIPLHQTKTGSESLFSCYLLRLVPTHSPSTISDKYAPNY
jgi:hypothetical protein